VRVDKSGPARPSDFNAFAVSDQETGGAPIDPADIATAKDYFAPAQFFEKSDTEKLSAESYVKYESGFAFGASDTLETGHYVTREVTYELSYIDSQRAPWITFFAGLFTPVAPLLHLFAKNRIVARSALSHAANRKSALAPDAVTVAQEGYAVANISNLTAAAGAAAAASEAEAVAEMARLVREDPKLAGKLQVVPSFELNRELAA